MEKKINITENEQSDLIRESVRTVMENRESDDEFDIDSIDISAIDFETLKDAYVDLRLVPTMTTFGDILSDIPNVSEDNNNTNIN